MRNALMIAYHYPPQSGSSGIQRTLSFSRHLPSFGWNPIVLTAHPYAYEKTDQAQLATIPPELRVHRAFAFDAKRHFGIMGRYPGILALPDRWSSWWFTAVPIALCLIRKHKIPVIWSTYPIASAHLIALTLRTLTSTSWVADFRDPMFQADYPVTPLERKVYKWIECETINRCDKAVFATFGSMEYYKARFAKNLHRKFVVVENGYDEYEFQEALTRPELTRPGPREKLTLLHSGILYRDGRSPAAYLQAVVNLRKCGAISPRTFSTVLRAPGDLSAIQSAVRQYQVEDMVRVEPAIPYVDALREMLSADGLLLFQGSEFNMQVPAKMYEYFRARKPIFGLVDPHGETAQALKTAGFNAMAKIDDADEVTVRLMEFIQEVHSGTASIAGDELVASSSRSHRAYELGRLFDEMKQ